MKRNSHSSSTLVFVLVCLCILLPICGYSSSNYKTILSIDVVGNNRTNKKVILRELEFTVGDEVHEKELHGLIDLSRNQIMKTGLFTRVKISQEQIENDLHIKVEVNELFYMLPVPVFKLLDRNINDWVRNHDADLKRVNWGFKVYHTNLTGNRDYFKSVVQFGYSQNFSLTYRQPFLNKQGTLGYEFKIAYKRLRDGTINTIGDQAVFLGSNDGRHFKFFETFGTVNLRVNNRFTHSFNASYTSGTISGYAAEVNPKYFSDQKNNQRYFGLRYGFSFDNRDKRFLANSGMRAEFMINKTGLGVYQDVDYLSVQLGVQKMFPLNPTKSIFFRWQPKVRYFLIDTKVPYNHHKALGYRHNIVRGFEDYVVDGQNFVLSRKSMMFRLYEKNIDLRNNRYLKRFEQLPFGIYCGLHYDMAYVDNPNAISSRLTNNWISGYGASLDFLIQENFHVSLEYSITHTNLSSFNVHTQFRL